jgi:RHS repeat-associated protein
VVNGAPTRYIFAGDVRLAKVTPSGVLHFHKDHLTSTAAVSNAVGEKIESADYIPFGQERNHAGQRVTHYKYTDQEFDQETGLYNYKARLYDPISEVFISSDPYLSPNFVFDLIQGPKSARVQGNFSSAGDKRKQTSGTKALVDFFSHTSQRLNRYAYVQNNPINFVDSSGLWPTTIHNKIIGETFKHLPVSLRSQIEKGSAFADKNQDTKSNHVHAMRQNGESAESASSKMQDYVNDHMNQYNWHKETWEICKDNYLIEKAYFELGMALHPIMDSTAPPHEGFQVWEGLFKPSSLSHSSQESAISDDQVTQTSNRIREAMAK